jgi:5'-AMP-activated protein kinase catalytic alpha subunit
LNFKIPNFVSLFGKDLIEGLLTVSNKRFSIEEIRQHDFYKLHREKLSTGILIGKQKIPVDENILMEVATHGFDKEFARQCI